jgi:hypothetical protein
MVTLETNLGAGGFRLSFVGHGDVLCDLCRVKVTIGHARYTLGIIFGITQGGRQLRVMISLLEIVDAGQGSTSCVSVTWASSHQRARPTLRDHLFLQEGGAVGLGTCRDATVATCKLLSTDSHCNVRRFHSK